MHLKMENAGGWVGEGQEASEALPASGSTVSVYRGVAICMAAGVLMSLWSPLSAFSMATDADGHCAGCLTPYASFFVFATAVLLSTPAICKVLMVCPLVGDPSTFSAFASLSLDEHVCGLLGGALWAFGTLCNLVSGAEIGLALSYAIGQSAPMVATAWGVFYYREFVGADAATTRLVVSMAYMYTLAIALTALSRALAT